MGIRNTAAQMKQYREDKRERDAAAGYQRKEVRVHRDDWPKVAALVAALNRARSSHGK